MSWDIYLQSLDGEYSGAQPGETLYMRESFEDGGTYALGGSNECHLNVTYNYSRHFDFHRLHGMPAYHSIPLLEAAIAALGTERDADYWNPTPGNVGLACQRLLSFAKEHPRGMWEVH